MSNDSSAKAIEENAQGYFYTDWSAMTSHDWAGMIITVVTMVLMVIAYFYVFRPKNKDKLEAQRFMLMDDEPKNTEKK
ncbi:cbb3-type cytochrome c oxidase subunit 3 [sulfur-oxidizing endosymbiont of Gigantopelta aegis]|uniref:cbb3-type cytochrome c oxidase subunit 3 n=1 Tax=sulfur-oxidizing endosymbiont of Gigantopelta aegis TaxID=2794934 RepID=UPI001FE6D679|nr:cbb3-type cytochrome c oxidase subunit 3 [sulfur-oxidizing endosymbiont of Gigantopelta aegis]